MSSNTCLSVLCLYNYVFLDGFENNLHLVFCVENLPELLLNQTICLLKAASIQNQYVISEQIRMFRPDFATCPLTGENLHIIENRIHNTIENIMAMDIALLKYVATVPEQIEKHSYKFPRNVDIAYLMGEYTSAKEKQIIYKISKALKLYEMSKFNDNFQQTYKLNGIKFDNTNYTSRLSSMDDDLIKLHDSKLLIEFSENFFKNKKIQSLRDVTTGNIPKQLLHLSVEIRETLFALSSVFSMSNDTNRQLRIFFEGSKYFKESTLKKAKSIQLTYRESYTYSMKFMTLVLYFTLIEENRYRNNIDDVMPDELLQLRNQFIIILTRMLEHIVDYIQYQSNIKSKITYSMLPIISGFDDLKNMPITTLLFTMQYTLNFASFLINSDRCD